MTPDEFRAIKDMAVLRGRGIANETHTSFVLTAYPDATLHEATAEMRLVRVDDTVEEAARRITRPFMNEGVTQ